MKIYFAASIRAGRQDAPVYAQIVALLKGLGHWVLSEHFGDLNMTEEGEVATGKITERQIYERDCAWIRECDAVVAEVTQPSLGVGYELSYAESHGKKVICLYRPQPGKLLSAMLVGNPRVTVLEYQNVSDLEGRLRKALA